MNKFEEYEMIFKFENPFIKMKKWVNILTC